MLGLKWQALAALPAEVVAVALIAGHAFSRSLGAMVMAALSYARNDDSRARPMVSDLKGDRLVLVLGLGHRAADPAAGGGHPAGVRWPAR